MSAWIVEKAGGLSTFTERRGDVTLVVREHDGKRGFGWSCEFRRGSAFVWKANGARLCRTREGAQRAARNAVQEVAAVGRAIVAERVPYRGDFSWGRALMSSFEANVRGVRAWLRHTTDRSDDERGWWWQVTAHASPWYASIDSVLPEPSRKAAIRALRRAIPRVVAAAKVTT